MMLATYENTNIGEVITLPIAKPKKLLVFDKLVSEGFKLIVLSNRNGLYPHTEQTFDGLGFVKEERHGTERAQH